MDCWIKLIGSSRVVAFDELQCHFSATSLGSAPGKPPASYSRVQRHPTRAQCLKLLRSIKISKHLRRNSHQRQILFGYYTQGVVLKNTIYPISFLRSEERRVGKECRSR